MAAGAEVCDTLIIGGGSAGCILARRLADARPDRVILLEAGPSDEGEPILTRLSRLDDQTPATDWGFRAQPFPDAPASLVYGRARMLGGCANHNDCAFIEAPDCDFETWEGLGARGWGPAAVRPWFRRVEELTHVDRNSARHPVSAAFVRACREAGLPEVDFRDRVAAGTGWFPLNARGDLRQSSSIAYLHPIAQRPHHLEVWTGVRADRLLLEGRRVVGAETSRGTILAREVILTAGAIQTPQLMMLSGLGPAEHLREHGIAVVADLPGVGAHLLDHPAAAVVWDLHEPVAPWGYTPFEAVTMIKVEPDAPAPDALYHFGLRVREKYADRPRFRPGRHAVKASPNVTRARSEGSVRLASADPHAAPRIALNYLSDPDGYDRRILLGALGFARRLIETPTWSRLVRAELSPGPEVQSEDEWVGYVREVCETVYHASGTCVMGDPARTGTVVDAADMTVKGIAGLRIADASVFPAMVTVNINFTVMMVAERAADLILGRR